MSNHSWFSFYDIHLFGPNTDGFLENTKGVIINSDSMYIAHFNEDGTATKPYIYVTD